VSTEAVAAFGRLLQDARSVVAFTGAGISTESGIPDFRSPGGVWTRYNPRDFTFAKYVRSAEVRVRAWAMRREFWRGDPQPNAAHRALVELESAERLAGVITQNIDGLHQAAGARTVLELHGTSRDVICIGAAPRCGNPEGCGFRAPMAWALAEVDAGTPDPVCPRCGGIIKAATVSFGQNLFPGSLEAAEDLMARADLVLAVGSSLQVYPAAGLPASAARAGVPLVICNDEPTPLDELATLLVRGRVGTTLPAAVKQVLLPEPVWAKAQDQAATVGWSVGEGPTFAAPPGEPRPVTASPKYSALMGVNWRHSSGTSSS
jgi:NAD-dependent deacetylase